MKKQTVRFVNYLVVILIGALIVGCQSTPATPEASPATAEPSATQVEGISTETPPAPTLAPATQTPESAPTQTNAQAMETTGTSTTPGSKAYLVIELGEENTVTTPITFTGSITGLDALLQTGLDVVTQETSFGVAVCSIEGVGCPADDCFCSPTNFWNYLNWDWAQNQWAASMVGPSGTTLTDYAFDGWRWQTFEDTVTPPPAPKLIAGTAMDYLLSKQDPTTGGYGSLGSTLDFLLAAGASELPVIDLKAQEGAPGLQDYILLEGAAYAEGDAGTAGKLAMGLASAQVCLPTGTKLPQDYYDPATGAYSDKSLFQAFAMLGVLSSGETVPLEAVAYLKSHIQPSGGWAWFPGEAEDSNTTAIAIQALIAAGEPVTSPEISNALTFLQSFQNSDGGFSYSQDYLGTSDGNSTAYAIQAILAAGQSPASEVWSKDGQNPLFYLLDLQLADGSFEWQPGSGSNDLATMQAVVALLNRYYPISTAGFSECGQ